jgi:hypothetical protein
MPLKRVEKKCSFSVLFGLACKNRLNFIQISQFTCGQRFYDYQTHILRDERPSSTACPARWAIGTNELKYCMVWK